MKFGISHEFTLHEKEICFENYDVKTLNRGLPRGITWINIHLPNHIYRILRRNVRRHVKIRILMTDKRSVQVPISHISIRKIGMPK